MGADNPQALRVTFAGRLQLEFHGSQITSKPGYWPTGNGMRSLDISQADQIADALQAPSFPNAFGACWTENT